MNTIRTPENTAERVLWSVKANFTSVSFVFFSWNIIFLWLYGYVFLGKNVLSYWTMHSIRWRAQMKIGEKYNLGGSKFTSIVKLITAFYLWIRSVSIIIMTSRDCIVKQRTAFCVVYDSLVMVCHHSLHYGYCSWSVLLTKCKLPWLRWSNHRVVGGDETAAWHLMIVVTTKINWKRGGRDEHVAWHMMRRLWSDVLMRVMGGDKTARWLVVMRSWCDGWWWDRSITRSDEIMA